MIQALFALTFNGFREARRNRVTVVVAVFAVTMLLMLTLVTEVTIITFERVLTDVGIGLMSMVLALLAIFLSSGQLSREIERRTLFLIVSKPISRGLFLIGRLAGNMLTLAVLLIAMAVLFCIQIKLYGAAITAAQLTAIGMLWFELLVISCVGFLISSFSSQMVSAVVTTGLYFAGHLSGDIYHLASKSKNAAMKAVGLASYYVLPNLSRLNFRPSATYNIESPTALILQSIAYALAYSLALVSLAVILFNRRDFK